MRRAAGAVVMTSVLAVAATACAPFGSATPGPRAPASRPSARSQRSAPAGRVARSSGRSPLAIAQATHEYPSPAVRQTVRGAVSDPVDAVRAFANAYINWNAATVRADLRALAARSVGQARSAMTLAAAQAGGDYELQRGGIANTGTVEAVARLPGGSGRFVVVTLERTTASATTAYEGLAAAWHVAVAEVAQVTPGHWAVSEWQPES